ncbi:acyl carrier protein [Aliiglaciecola litoralis]|uniref:Acyl carrier protein n=1 Tax=Aliiglaciecola litoralis TaxID=582857 RepID=A0ABP3WW06_9ALTE
MKNEQILINAFSTSLGIEAAMVTQDLTYNTIPQWDSTAHMILIAELEDQFKVMLDTDDIIDMGSVAKAKEILAKYDIEFDA